MCESVLKLLWFCDVDYVSIITVVICNTTLANTDYESCITRIIHHRLEVTSFRDTLERAVYDQVHDGVVLK